ncbi:MAG: class I SAM-dependent methyltransferase [Nanoarchaeota archaeon]|nr:class I SAM-dependent methyltransferase [Nanoarchaeota archaeon]
MREYLEHNRRTYDALAEEYKHNLETYAVADQKILFPFIGCLKARFSNPRVLELGPGSGLALQYFAREGFNTTAIDISSEIIKVAEQASPSTHYLLGDFLGFDFGGLIFDGIFAKAFIHLFPKDDAMLVFRKIFGLLSRGGVAYLATTRHEVSEEGFFEKSDYQRKEKRFRRRWAEGDLLEAIINTGFDIYNRWYDDEPDKGKKWINILAVKPF